MHNIVEPTKQKQRKCWGQKQTDQISWI